MAWDQNRHSTSCAVPSEEPKAGVDFCARRGRAWLRQRVEKDYGLGQNFEEHVELSIEAAHNGPQAICDWLAFLSELSLFPERSRQMRLKSSRSQSSVPLPTPVNE